MVCNDVACVLSWRELAASGRTRSLQATLQSCLVGQDIGRRPSCSNRHGGPSTVYTQPIFSLSLSVMLKFSASR